MRQGAANNIYVIPSPHELDFNTATLLAAACCIPAILSLVSMWIKIMDDNWENLKLGNKSKKKEDHEPIDGTNGATPLQMKGIAERIRGWLTLIEIPVFIAAVLAIVVKGEMNFWSTPVDYQTEPMASVGKLYFRSEYLSFKHLQSLQRVTNTSIIRSMGTNRGYRYCHCGITVSNYRS